MSKGKGRGKPPRHIALPTDVLAELFSELETTDERTAGIVAGSIVENSLAIAIQTRMRALDPGEKKQLFEGSTAPMGTFHTKIMIGYAVGLYSYRVRDDLDRLREIRNKFAHHIFVKSFDHDEVKDLVDALVGPTFLRWAKIEANLSNRRYCFLETAFHLLARFDLESKDVRLPEPSKALSYEHMPQT
jgi:hypothetical protein